MWYLVFSQTSWIICGWFFRWIAIYLPKTLCLAVSTWCWFYVVYGLWWWMCGGFKLIITCGGGCVCQPIGVEWVVWMYIWGGGFFIFGGSLIGYFVANDSCMCPYFLYRIVFFWSKIFLGLWPWLEVCLDGFVAMMALCSCSVDICHWGCRC